MNEKITQDKLQNVLGLSKRSSKVAINIIDGLAQRGAFKGEEFIIVGQLRNDCIMVSKLIEELESEVAQVEQVTESNNSKSKK